MTYIGMLRVRNEARWIRHAIESLRFCKSVYVFDDHSTDDTVRIARELRAIVVKSPFDGFDEIRDKNYILAFIQECEAGEDVYIVHIDGDEELEKDAHQKLEMVSGPLAMSLQVFYLWDSVQVVRIDGIYNNFFRPSIMKLPKGQVSFRSSTHNVASLHCSNVIADYLPDVVRTPIRIWHYGYLDRNDRIKKYEWYNKIDPDNQFEDRYIHTVIGDIFPSSYEGRHAGPLRLRSRPD
jgi:glycosyltransferase involved in cell wall biosynthesis